MNVYKLIYMLEDEGLSCDVFASKETAEQAFINMVLSYEPVKSKAGETPTYAEALEAWEEYETLDTIVLDIGSFADGETVEIYDGDNGNLIMTAFTGMNEEQINAAYYDPEMSSVDLEGRLSEHAKQNGLYFERIYADRSAEV